MAQADPAAAKAAAPAAPAAAPAKAAKAPLDAAPATAAPAAPAKAAAKTAAKTGLPACNGGNGVAGLDCLSAWGYPRKTAGRPYGPMNDAYTPDGPTYASRLQTESHHRHHHHHKNRQDESTNEAK